MDQRAIETYDRAYNRAARVARELRAGLVRVAGMGHELPTAEELGRLADLRRELDTLNVVLDVDVLR